MTLLYWLLVKAYNLQQNFCVMTYKNLQSGVPNGKIKLNPEKTKVIIFSRSPLARNSKPILKLHGVNLKIYRQVKFLVITFDSKFTFQKHFEEILGSCNTRYHLIRLQQKMGTQPVQHVTNLQTMCPVNFRVWVSFDHNNIEHDNQQHSTAPEQIYPSCPEFTKIH